MHGNGILGLTNGDKFEGHFKEGIIDGPGVYHSGKGQSI
jgi:hypothetical protein